MIYVKQDISKKIPGETSLFISSSYNQKLIEIIKGLIAYNFDSKTNIWEIPISELSNFLDSASAVDDISLSVRNFNMCVSKNYDLQNYITTPFDYQIDAIQYGLNHDRWLLLDAPGLGKSLTMIYLAQELKQRDNLQHCLIVCGVNTLKTNWKKEILYHSNLPCRILGEKISKTGKVSIGTMEERLQQLKDPIDEFFVITNIETLRNEKIVKQINSGKNNTFDMIVVDEIHCAKNPKSSQGKGLLKLSNAKYRIGLTGTLYTNSPEDCYLPLKWIGSEHSNFSTFKNYYCVYGGTFGYDLLGYRNLNVLKTQLQGNSLRRTKDILNLPPKTIINEYVDMNNQQETFYNNIKSGVVEQADKVELNAQQVLSMVTRLRQATSCPQMLTTESITSSKIDRCVDLVTQILNSNEKVVIFTTFKESSNELFTLLEDYGAVLNTGDTDDQEVSNNVTRFQTDPNCKIFIGTWQKCGTGITLTQASYMIFIDTPWTPAVYTQAQDRIYRVGTTKNVTIYNLICSHSIDERVLSIINDKEMIGDYIIDNKITNRTYEKLKSIIQDLK